MNKVQKEDTPDAKSEESSNDEDIIKDSKCNEQLVKSLSKIFPLHDKYGDTVA